MSLSPTHPDAVRQLDRLADRLRVVGPRLAARDGAPAHELLASIRAGLQELADLAADADRRPRRPVPELPAHALADQALVLGHDLLGVPEPGRPAELPSADLAPPERSDLFRATAVDAITRIQRLI